MAFGVFLAVLLFPASAWAWGPGAHLSFSLEILDSLSSFAPLLRDLLRAFPYDFLYGNISADIIVGRRYAEYKHHCHNWTVGLQVLDRAGNRAQRAFAYGYLGHLAADTIAHNYFVPYQMLAAFPNRVLRHNYWEMRFDSLVAGRVWETVKRMNGYIDKGDDVLLEKTLKRVVFSFKTNRRIFSSILLIQRMRRWRGMIRAHSSASKWKLTQEDFRKYSRRSCEAMSSVLRESSHSRYFRLDPTGWGALSTARTLSSVLRALARRNRVSSSLLSEILRDVEPDLSVRPQA